MKNAQKILLREFRSTHDCKCCMYYQTDKCKADMQCYLEKTERNEHSALQAMRIKKGCLTKEGKECPYGNEVGTCFGFCMIKILEEMKENETKQEEQTNG